MNPYLDHLLDIVVSDGSYVYSSPGVETIGLPDVERVAQIALLVELRAVVTELRAIRQALSKETPAA